VVFPLDSWILMTRMGFGLPFSGLLRSYGDDLKRLQRLLDPLLVTALFWRLVLPRIQGSSGREDLVALVLVCLASAVVLPQGRLYQSYRQASLLTLLRRLSVSWLLVLALLLTLAYGLKVSANYSRLDMLAWAGLCWLALVLLHLGGRKLLRWYRIRGGNSRLLVYWGPPRAAEAFYRRLQACPYLGLRMVAWFSDCPPANPDALLPEMPYWGGGLQALRSWLAQNRVDQLVFSDGGASTTSTDELIQLFGDTCIPVVYAPLWAAPGMRFALERVGDQPCIDLWRPHDSLLDRQLKRGFDLLVAASALVVLSPLLVLVAVAVRCSSPGPALFWQDRYGLDGHRFRIAKFRTMRVLEAGDQPGLSQASRHDPRVTPLGAFLRRWSIDELPQLWNVFWGDMSLVGPRPHAVEHNEHFRRLIPGYMQRHLFKPGITGLAQVQGFRGETATLDAMQRRIAADLDYQRDWSLAGDLKILLQTLLQLRSNNAY
jgi:putative colanic acid biosynthesis UDP-glucose lipid carrier transferase